MASPYLALEQQVKDLTYLRSLFQDAVHNLHDKQRQQQHLLDEIAQMQLRIQQLAIRQGKSQQETRELRLLTNKNQKYIKELKLLQRNNKQKQLNLVQKHYSQEIKQLESLLDQQAQLIQRLQKERSCSRCQDSLGQISSLTERVRELEQLIDKLSRGDEVRIELQDLKNSLCEVKRQELQKIDRLFQSLR